MIYENNKICNNCKSNFTAKSRAAKFCSKDCRDVYNKNKKYEGKTEGVDYIVCKWCGTKCERIYGQHLKLSHPDKSKEDYKLEFPDAPLYCDKDKENFSKSSGLHMKESKYRKMFSDKIKGDNNPNHKTNTTIDERKERSPYSIKFYTSKGYSKEEAKKIISEYANMEKRRTTDLEYWLEETNGDVKKAESLLKERQSTFSLDKCIEKYGKDEGTKRWKNRQKKWLNNYKKNSFSKISQDLFIKIYEYIKSDFNDIYFATLNENKEIDDSGKNYEFRLQLDDRVILPDFYIKDLGKIIEFDGAYWHRHDKKSDKFNKSREANRDNSIIEYGNQVYHVKELDYYKDPQKVIQKCLDFIYDI